MTDGDNFCSHLILCVRVKNTGYHPWFECTCQYDMAAGCIPDGKWCPVKAERDQIIKEMNKA